MLHSQHVPGMQKGDTLAVNGQKSLFLARPDGESEATGTRTPGADHPYSRAGRDRGLPRLVVSEESSLDEVAG